MLWRMKREYVRRYDWVLPWPGDLHISLNFAKTLLNHNNFKLMLEPLGIKYGLKEGQRMDAPSSRTNPNTISRQTLSRTVFPG